MHDHDFFTLLQLGPDRVDIMADSAGVAELADARDSKSRGPQGPCGFDSHPRHQAAPTENLAARAGSSDMARSADGMGERPGQ